MQWPNSEIALGKNWDDVANDANALKVKVANKNYLRYIRNIRRPRNVVLKVKYL